jgi:DNA-binding LacI/PurR family transcriptional regulator
MPTDWTEGSKRNVDAGSLTLREIARRAGVSIATASRVAAGLTGVREETRIRVLAVIEQAGFLPDPLARALAGGGGDQLGLIILATPEALRDDPHYARVIAAAANETLRHSLTLTVHLADETSLTEVPPLSGDRRYVGALTVNVTAKMMCDLRPAQGRCPVVSLGRSTRSVPFVDPENVAGAMEAVRHLINQGRRRIAIIAGPSSNPCARERLLGYQRAVDEAGLPTRVVNADFTRSGADRAARRMLARWPSIDSVFATSDLMAAGSLSAFAAIGRMVPDDIAIVGFDDSSPSRTAVPALSTVLQPVEDIVALAIQTLLAPPPTRPHEQRLPTQLIVRESSAA